MIWSFCDASTGIFSWRKVSCSVEDIGANTRPGEIAVPGEYDRMRERVDIDAWRAAGDAPEKHVVPFVPPQAMLDAAARRQSLRTLLAQRAAAAQRAILANLPPSPERDALRAIDAMLEDMHNAADR